MDLTEVSNNPNNIALEIMGGGYFVKCNSNEIYEKEFTATDPWEYQDCFTEKMNYGSMFAASVGGMQQKSEVVP